MEQDMESKPNIPLLRKAVEWAEAEAAKAPEVREWLQRGASVMALLGGMSLTDARAYVLATESREQDADERAESAGAA
jgi:hypothetical protein